jgi:hypothetical protein
MRETANDAREAVRKVRNAAADSSGDLQNDFQTLRDDFGRLAEQVGEIVADKGNAAWHRAKSSVDDMVSDASDRGREAVGASARFPTTLSMPSTSRSRPGPIPRSP